MKTTYRIIAGLVALGLFAAFSGAARTYAGTVPSVPLSTSGKTMSIIVYEVAAHKETRLEVPVSAAKTLLAPAASTTKSVAPQAIEQDAVGRIIYQDGFAATGFISVADNLLSTAAHNLWSDFKTWLPIVEVDFGGSAISPPRYRCTPLLYAVSGEYHDRLDLNYDYGAIRCAENIGRLTGRFGMTQVTPAIGTQVSINGYPFSRGGDQVLVNTSITTLEAYKVYYNPELTERGHSGSPVYVLQNGQPYSIAIHSGGDPGIGGRGTRVTNQVLEFMYWVVTYCDCRILLPIVRVAPAASAYPPPQN